MWNICVSVCYGMCISKRRSFQFSSTFEASQPNAPCLEIFWIYYTSGVSNPLINYLFTFKVFAELCEQETKHIREEKEREKKNEMKWNNGRQWWWWWRRKNVAHVRTHGVSSRQSINVGKFHCWNGCVGVWFWLNCIVQVLKICINNANTIERRYNFENPA